MHSHAQIHTNTRTKNNKVLLKTTEQKSSKIVKAQFRTNIRKVQNKQSKRLKRKKKTMFQVVEVLI